MSTRKLRALSIAGALVALLAAGARAEEPRRSAQQLELRGYEAYQVRLARPFTHLTASGEKVTSTEAYVVRLEVSEPGFWGEKVDFFVGDQRIPEYGGWSKGIYFKVYDRAAFDALRGGELRYRIGDGPILSFERRFEVADPAALPRVPEAQLVPGAAPK